MNGMYNQLIDEAVGAQETVIFLLQMLYDTNARNEIGYSIQNLSIDGLMYLVSDGVEDVKEFPSYYLGRANVMIGIGVLTDGISNQKRLLDFAKVLRKAG